MEQEEKYKIAILKGYKYNSKNGIVYTIRTKANQINKRGYLHFSFYHLGKYYNITAHQFAWYYTYNQIVECLDHINRNKLDNRIENLRSVTRSQNQFNRTNTKGYTERIYKDSIYYIAQIYINRKKIHLGSYITKEEARNAYLQAKEKYHII